MIFLPPLIFLCIFIIEDADEYLDKKKHKAGRWEEAIASMDDNATLQGLSYAQKHENSTTPC